MFKLFSPDSCFDYYNLVELIISIVGGLEERLKNMQIPCEINIHSYTKLYKSTNVCVCACVRARAYVHIVCCVCVCCVVVVVVVVVVVLV